MTLLDRLKRIIPTRRNKEIPPSKLDLDPSAEGHDDKLEILKKMLPFFERPVTGVMTPRADIDWIDLNQPFSKVQKYVLKSSHNYFPVCQHDLDKVVGRISLKRVLLSKENLETAKLEKFAEPILYVSPSMSCLDLMVRMRQEKNHMAIVIDEFGGVDGLVTLSDLAQKVIGETDPDGDHDIEASIHHKDGTITVDGRMLVEKLQEEVPGLILQDKNDDTDSVGGLVSTLAGRIPSRGELVKHGTGLIFEVLTCDARRVKKVRLHHVKEALAPVSTH